jgi:transmembrane sensor
MIAEEGFQIPVKYNLNLMDYSKFKVEDFVQNEQFALWVKHPTIEGDKFWAFFLKQHPEQVENVAVAKDMLLAIINQPVYPLSEVTENEILENINNEINREPMIPVVRMRWYWVAASAIFLLSAIGFWYFDKNVKHTEGGTQNTYQDMVDVAKVKMSEQKNATNEPLRIKLSDGSQVTLQKNSKVSYLENFDGNLREVYLSGEAFFEVKKDASRPFLVYANGLVTKVLGTSFTVSAYDTDKAVKVSVRTGKVSVFSQKDRNEQGKGLVILPNQQIIFDKAEVRMIKSVVEQPTILDNTVETTGFEFVDDSIKKVFQRLQKAYGIEIVYDEDVMRECFLTASLYEEKSLYDKLKLICKVTESSYEITDGKVIIQSRGCK